MTAFDLRSPSVLDVGVDIKTGDKPLDEPCTVGRWELQRFRFNRLYRH
ncbi:MAG: hypothetical protein ACRD2T_09610 [Thermoanaerobaculia bacterium]